MALVGPLFLATTLVPAAGDQLFLRNTDIIKDRKVKQFDEDGVQLDDGRTITWDLIELGKVDPDKQVAFDKMLAELGTPLYRIRQRLRFGDYQALLEHAEAVYPRYKDRSSPTAYMVFQSLMWARIAAGQREQAVEPYLRAYEYLRRTRTQPELPGDRRLQFDGATALSPTLQPVWFDTQSAKSALDGVRRAARAMQSPYPEGVYIYYGTLALAAGDEETGLGMLKLVQGRHRATAELKQIALAQHEVISGKPDSDVTKVETTLQNMLPQNQPAAYYWVGLAKAGQENERDRLEGVLSLLKVPALYGKQSPELAGASLYQAMNTMSDLDDVKGSLAIRRELQVRYAHTSHAAKLRDETTTKSDSN